MVTLLFSSVAMSQDENGLTFSQVLIVDITNEVVVPEGKVWKVVSIMNNYHTIQNGHVYINDLSTIFRSGISTGSAEYGTFQGPFWLPSGTSVLQNEHVSRLNIIEFNTD